MKNRRGPNAEPERMGVRMEGLEICAEREDEQHEITAIAQFFNVVNDRMMIFRKGSFVKTIAEGVTNGSGRVKVNDSHRHTGVSTLGTVVQAEERDVGVWFRALISSTEGDFVKKVEEGHVDETSIEFFSIEEGTTRVPLEDVPEGAFIWDQSTGDGTVEVRELQVVSWTGVAILPYSSQRRSSILEVNAAVPYQDLPVAAASTPWAPSAAEDRVYDWAGKLSRSHGDPITNFARLSSAYMVRGPMKDGSPQLLGQIADVVDGELVVVPEALSAAMEGLAANPHLGAPDMIACATIAGRYEQKLTSGLARRSSAALQSHPADVPAGPAPVTPPTVDRSSDEDSDPLRETRIRLNALAMKIMAHKIQEPI